MPSDLATGSTEQVEDERRLLYAAMTPEPGRATSGQKPGRTARADLDVQMRAVAERRPLVRLQTHANPHIGRRPEDHRPEARTLMGDVGKSINFDA